MPKIAIASHGSPDYLIDIVADGMTRLLGRENVHFDYRIWNRPGFYYPLLFDEFQKPNTFPIHEADALIVSNRCHPSTALEWMARTGKRDVAFVDGEDEDWLRQCPPGVKVYFKREYFGDRAYPGNVKPLPFAAIPEKLPEGRRRILPIAFTGTFSSHIRHHLMAAMREMNLPVILGTLPKDKYNALMCSCYVGLAARGAGWDTYRYWEIPYFGCALLAQRMPIVVPENYVDGVEAIFYENTDDFRKKLKVLLESPETIRRIAAAGQKACIERHLSVHRAKRILEELL